MQSRCGFESSGLEEVAAGVGGIGITGSVGTITSREGMLLEFSPCVEIGVEEVLDAGRAEVEVTITSEVKVESSSVLWLGLVTEFDLSSSGVGITGINGCRMVPSLALLRIDDFSVDAVLSVSELPSGEEFSCWLTEFAGASED